MKTKTIISHSTIATIFLIMGLLIGAIIFSNTYILNIDQTNTTSQTVYNVDIIKILNGIAYFEKIHNTYTNIGKGFERNLKFWKNVTQSSTEGAINWVALSNDATPLATWTQLASEATTLGAGRKIFDTMANINGTTINGTVTFTFTGAITLQTVGIQWKQSASSNNNLYAVFVFTQTTFANNDQLIIRYYNSEAGT